MDLMLLPDRSISNYVPQDDSLIFLRLLGVFRESFILKHLTILFIQCNACEIWVVQYLKLQKYTITNKQRFQMFGRLISKCKFGSQSKLVWKRKFGGVMIRFPISLTDNALIYVYPGWNFMHLLASLSRNFKTVNLEEMEHIESDVCDFLEKNEKPMSVTIQMDGHKYALVNKSMQWDCIMISKSVNNSESIYGKMSKLLQEKKIKAQFDLNNFIIKYNLKLHILHFMRVKNIPLTAKMQGGLRSDILTEIMMSFDHNHQHELRLVEAELDRVRSTIKKTSQLIEQINIKIQKRIKLYRYGAIAITLTHFTSFTYMIFFVDWIGWDIIEPTTYTISIIYSLIAIRFYRKHQKDRSDQNVKSSLTQIVSAPNDRMKLKKYEYILQTQQSELRKYEQRKIILKDKLWYSSKMADLY